MNFDNILNPDFVKMISPEFIVSMAVMLIIIIFSFVVYFKQKKYSAFDEPKGIVKICEFIVDFADKQVSDIMGCPRYFHDFGAYVICLFLFIFLGFFIGMMGIPNLIVLGSASEGYIMNETKLFSTLPNPFTNLAFTLTIGFLTVVMIEITKLRTDKFNYWKQFVFTFPPLLPIATNFVPMISLGVRLFGNSFAGYCIMTLIYGMFSSIGNGLLLVASPLIMPFLHFYFDLFSGLIQSVVFTMLTMMDIAQCAPSEEAQKEIAQAATLKASM